uniref:Zinc finger protein 862-like n=1 Tax=Saccoglossus kowalevskii TaxID=10224 RepID=A0ABM0LUV1_SACKO|nr:PREDICTED: zinc finger protein 862-like [Saccoglossus kowalevskii]
MDLAKSLGCSYFDAMSSCEHNYSYTSERTVQEMVLSIGEVIRQDVLEEFDRSPFISLLIDETTDVAVMKQLIIYDKHLQTNGTTKVSFLGTVEVQDRKAETITTAIKTFTEEHNIILDGKLAGFGSDGASVMVSSFMISNHCVAHKLALAVGQAANSVPYIKKFNDLLDNLYRFYEYSPVRSSGLKEIQKAMTNQVLKPKQAKAVRWLSHEAACETLRQIYPSIIISLHRETSERNDPAALGLAKFLEEGKFFATLHMMCDILQFQVLLDRFPFINDEDAQREWKTLMPALH